MRKPQTDKKNISIRMSIIILFIALMVFIVLFIGHVVFSNWLHSADETIKDLAEDMNSQIFKQVDAFISTPLHINEDNLELIKNGVVDLNDETERENFFVSILKTHKGENLYSFSYGTENGEYYGARKNENGEIEIIKNDAETYGHTFYYTLTEEMTAGGIVMDAGPFDPRKRSWYEAAKENQKPIFSPVYKHFILNDLALSAASPFYDKGGKLQGVLGAHMSISIIDNYLREIVKAKKAVAVIVEKNSGELIANSLNINNFKITQDSSLKRTNIGEIGNQELIQAYENYKSTNENNFQIKSENDPLYINVKEYEKEGLNWLVITAVPASLFTSGIYNSMTQSLLLILTAFLISLIIYFKVSNKFLKPMVSLIEATEKFSKGDLLQRAEVVRNDELGEITKSFNKMADTMYALVNNLEEKVQERTLELDETNNELRETVDHIKYLSFHDSLTGLYNRMFFEQELKNIEAKENLPVSIIFGDVNGLKLTNDIFGHAAGDELLKKSAEILNKVCRKEDVVARVGGDEFAIILPNTEASAANKIVARIKKELSKEHIAAIKCSMSMGYDTKTSMEQELVRTMENAEDGMYKEKTLNRKNVNSDMINTIIETLHSKSPREKQHSINVSELCHDLGQFMKLQETEVKKLKEAGFLHDIGKIVIKEDLLNKNETLTAQENKTMQQHPIVGYRILNLFEETLDLAEGVLSHHERWDGTGYPKGLKGEEIPMLARIITVAEFYDARTNPLNKNAMNKKEALEEMKKLSETKFDPKVMDNFLSLMNHAV